MRAQALAAPTLAIPDSPWGRALITALTPFFNQIAATVNKLNNVQVQTQDAAGNPVFDSNGNPVYEYTSTDDALADLYAKHLALVTSINKTAVDLQTILHGLDERITALEAANAPAI